MDAIAIPGGRDVRAVLDGDRDAGSAVVACPPHPQFGGSRTDQRLRAVSDALVDRGAACLRFDYGPWDGGSGERTDAQNALEWATDRFDSISLFGYSFGAGIALGAAATEPGPDAVSALAPPGDAVGALDRLDCPVQILYGERDDTVDWEPVVARAKELDMRTDAFPADHHFVGQSDRVARSVADFLVDST